MNEEYGNIPDGFFLSDKEVNDLRKAKKELTQYGKQKIKEMTVGQLMDTEKFQEEFSKPKVFDADKFADEERKQRKEIILQRYNDFYNLEVSGLSHGTPTSMEELQCISLRSMLDALITEHMNQEYNSVEICDVEDLIDGLYQQGKNSIKNIEEFKDSADGVV
jgi:hypothetical protein